MNRLQPHDPDQTRRLLIAMFLMGIGLLAWHYIYEYPRQLAAQKQAVEVAVKQEDTRALLEKKQKAQHEEALAAMQEQPRLKISSPEMEGDIGLRGARLQYLVLKHYAQEAKKGSPPVELLKPGGDPQSYFLEFGWLSEDASLTLPDSQTLWQTNDAALTPETPVTLFWENGQGLRFEIGLALKDEYLIAVDSRVINTGAKTVTVLPYGYINRTLPTAVTENLILHEGPLGVMDGSLTEISYSSLIEDREVTQANATGWIGITDKYWLTALIPPSGKPYTANFKSYAGANGSTRFQVDYLGQPLTAGAGTTASQQTLVFAGAKKLLLLDRYADELKIPLFDRAVDLGFLYFLTKPLFLLLHSLYQVAGDFGLAILIMTVLVKLSMYPLANKSYISMNEMKRLQPKLQELKERYGTDKMKFNQEMMQLYKREKINPAAGCLPLIIQMPVFFALYKVLFVTLEMRHANFYGIIRDLSAPDPTNIFNAFGLIDWTPPALLHLGILAILFAVSMWVQQSMNPKPTDPAQAKVMGWLPWIFMFIMAGFPAGLLIYWIWSNILSILQQWSIKTRFAKREKRRERVA